MHSTAPLSSLTDLLCQTLQGFLTDVATVKNYLRAAMFRCQVMQK